MTPVNSFSMPMGISSGTTPRPNSSSREARVRSLLALSRSALLITIIRGREYSSQNSHTFSVCTSTPATASTTTTAASAALTDSRVSARNGRYPGVSRMLIFFLFHSQWARAQLMLILRSISSSSQSVTVLPSSTRPRRLTAPESNKIADVREVLPAAP